MRSVLLLAVSISLVAIVTSVSNSDPLQLFNCNAMDTKFGCEPRFWISGNRKNCANISTNIMTWVTKSMRSDCYVITAGSESSPATTYIPNEFIEMHIRVVCYKMNYRGILFYAVDSTETKVGGWDIPNNDPPLFVQPWKSTPTHPCAGSVMHNTAEWKPYHSVLYFKAPAAGTGPITFRALIKYGNANTGDFFWPRADVVLQEAPVAQTTLTWRTSDPGTSCNEACSGQCSENELQGLNSVNAVMKSITPATPCQLPILSGCGVDGATYDPDHQYCYYADSTCAAQNRAPSAVTCDTKTDAVTRLCPCDTAMEVSPASQNVPFGIFSLFAVFSLLFGNFDRRFILGLVLFSGIALGHNWISSVSRSPAASTYRPCKPPLTDLPHAQVGPNQPFQVEWMCGHGDFAYFVIIHSRNVAKLKSHTTAMLNDYIAKAPNGTNRALDPNLQRFHLKTNPSLNNEVAEFNVTNYFEGVIYANDSRFIVRPATFGSAGLKYQMEYRDSALSEDVRVSYQSATYPWIEAVYKFKLSTLNAGRPDTANFIIPGFGGTGRYIVQYLWRGYYDCVDVDYKAAAVADVYGIPFNGTRWTRIDHCLFENVQRIFHTSRIYTDPKYCLNLCTSTECFGVNVVPLMAPPSVYQQFRLPPGNYTWPFPNIYGTDMYVPWSEGFFNGTRDAYLAQAGPQKYMCYSVWPRDFTDTQDEYTVSNDPEDPIFYSTCYYRFRGNLFAEYLNTSTDTVDVPWRYNDKCIGCENQAKNTNARNLFPTWDSPNVCVNCEREPGQIMSTPAPNVVEPATRCDGSLTNQFSRAAHHTCPNTTVCWKQLRALGRNTAVVTLDECAAMVSEDTACSNNYFYRAAASTCFCYKTDACCKSCSRVPDALYASYEKTASADPTCARGVRSTDGASCCSGTCGAGNCGNTTAAIDPVGFCCSTCIPTTRPCSRYGPPCKLI